MSNLFSSGEQARCSYQVDGNLSVLFEAKGKEFNFNADKALVGTVEHLLANKSYAPAERIYNLKTADDTIVEEVPLHLVNGRFRDFDQGIDSNVFLARLLEAANEYYVDKQKLLPKEISEYQLRAKAYYTFVDALRRVNIQAKNSDLGIFVDQCRGTSIFKDGLLWGRGSTGSVLQLPPEPLKKYIEAFDEGAVICKEGSEGSNMYVLLQGTVSVQVGNEFVAHLSQPGEAIGELSLFLEDRRSATLVADERVLLYVIPQEDLLLFHGSHPDLFLIIARTTADRVYHVLERVKRYHFAMQTKEGTAKELIALKKELATRGRVELRDLQKGFTEICEKAGDDRLNRIWAKMQATSPSD